MYFSNMCVFLKFFIDICTSNINDSIIDQINFAIFVDVSVILNTIVNFNISSEILILISIVKSFDQLFSYQISVIPLGHNIK